MPDTESKRPDRPYHHGNLAPALLQAALETIEAEGLDALTLRGVGAKTGVSRTALYRHFDSKAALLARVALEGFQLLHETMTRAIANSSIDTEDTLHVMAAAHVLFAQANPAHYLTMFGGSLADWSRYPDLIREADAALGQIADVVREEQRRGRLGARDPVELAEVFWSLTHGIATLAASKRLPRTSMSAEELAVLGSRFLMRGMRSLPL